MRRRVQVCFHRNGGHGRKRKLAAYIRNKNRLYLRIRTDITISFSYYYLLLDGFEYVYLKLDSVFYLLRKYTHLIQFT